jgi:ubiquinone/menaquinone biosynthesis C-methylase UbiE
MRRFNIPNLNSEKYWDEHQTALDFGLRQQKYVALAGQGEKIIELGCGLSPFLHHVSFQEKWGLDLSLQTIKKARKLFPEVNYIQGSAIDTPFHDEYFDVCVAGELIEHLEHPEDLIKEMTRITKGTIILSTPHLEFDDPEHLWEFYEDDFTEMGFKCETIESERFAGRSYLFAYKTK